MPPRVNAFRYRRERRQGRQVREVAGRVRRAGVVVAVAETGAVAGSGVARTEEWVCRRLVHGSRAWLLRPRHSRRRALVPVCALGGEVRELVMVQHPENSRARGCSAVGVAALVMTGMRASHVRQTLQSPRRWRGEGVFDGVVLGHGLCRASVLGVLTMWSGSRNNGSRRHCGVLGAGEMKGRAGP